MPTRKIVPRANGEGAIGDNTAGAEKYWGGGYFNVINGTDAIEMAAFNNSLQWKASIAYAIGDVVFTSELKAGQYLECTTDGTSGSAKPTIPATVVPNTTTITDNTVTWIVRQICSTQIDDSYSRKPNTTYLQGEIRFLYGELPVGWFLECSVAGISGSGDLTITTPTEGDTVTDGTVTWVMKKMGAGSGGDGVPLGAIIAYSANGELPSGYLLCDGSAVSRTMFPDLFAAIGTTYGAGDGSTTFNLPDYNAAERVAQGSTVAGNVMSFGVTGSSYSALTTRYIIKAFDGQTADSALIDITQYAQELAGKADRDLDNLSADGENHFLERNFTIIYPNGGSEAIPATITSNSRYVESNPFPDYYISAKLEILSNNQWVEINTFDSSYNVSTVIGQGACIGLVDNDIVIQTGSNSLAATSSLYGGLLNITSNAGVIISAPCRVKVWKIGKIPTA